METTYTIRLAHTEELPQVREIERAAAALFLTTPYANLSDGEPLALEFLQGQQAQGLLWVAVAVLGDGEEPVGFAVARVLDGAIHLEELDVTPTHGQRGLGRQLVQTLCEWATQAGYSAVTLSTFRDLPWNAPFYARLGFRQLPAEALTPGLLALRHKEEQNGLSVAERVIMRWQPA